MYRIFTIALLLFLVGWNVVLRIPAPPEIDIELKPYVKTFSRYCKLYKKDCSKLSEMNIKIVDMNMTEAFNKLLGLDYSVIGLCMPTSNAIQINKRYFENSTPAEIEQLIIHELGHCVLNKKHSEDTELDIMNPYALPEYMYLSNYSFLINSFFNCKKNCVPLEFDLEQY